LRLSFCHSGGRGQAARQAGQVRKQIRESGRGKDEKSKKATDKIPGKETTRLKIQ
jgi:hypothetical protein